MREELQEFKDSVVDRTVFILGGGSSVTQEILQFLNNSDKLVFCLNSSAKYIERPIGILWCDDSWASSNLEFLNSKDCIKFYVRSSASNYIKNNIKAIGKSNVIEKKDEIGFSFKIDEVSGNNSGSYAINFLINCGVRRIALVGFDMHVNNGKAHFHNDYTYSIRPQVYTSLFIPSIEHIHETIKKYNLNVEIFNCNRESSLKCFDYKDIRDI